MELPVLGVSASLSGIIPNDPNGKWSDEAGLEFARVCSSSTNSIIMYVDRRLKKSTPKNPIPKLEVTLYEEAQYKRTCINALLAFQGHAQLIKPDQPFFQRVSPLTLE